MDQFSNVPEWLGAAVVGAVLAALGYILKGVLELSGRYIAIKSERRARLITLQSLLRASRRSFEIQKGHAQTLLDMLKTRLGDIADTDRGYEYVMSRAHGTFTQDEKELHSIIRSMTVNSLWPTNSAMLDWLASDTYFKTQPHKPGLHGQLAQELTQLEAHLQLWKAKYLAWIPDHPEHGLVYMADEGMHGLSFPGAIDGLVDRVVKETS